MKAINNKTNNGLTLVKRWLVLVLTGLFTLQAGAQFRSIPGEVTDNFKSKFPKATHVTWKDKLSSFTAEFDQNNEKLKAFFTSKGNWLRTEKPMDFEKLPGVVKDGFSKSKYAMYDVKEVIGIDDSEKGYLYKVVVKKGDITGRNLFFTSKGQLVKDDFKL